MTTSDHRHGAGDCPNCGRFVDLDRNGRYRRHFVIEDDGGRHLCMASGRSPDEVRQLLAADPTPQTRYSHTRLTEMTG